jgi:uncharacterized protein YraI
MLNMRAGPGTEHAIVFRIPADGINVRVGECKSVSGYEFKWCTAEYDGARGWVYSRYLAEMSTNARPE